MGNCYLYIILDNSVNSKPVLQILKLYFYVTYKFTCREK